MWNNFQDGPPKICDAVIGIRTRNHAVRDTERSAAGNCNYIPTFCRQLPGSNWYSRVPFPLPRDVTFSVRFCKGCVKVAVQYISLPVLSGCQFCSRYADGLIVGHQVRDSPSRTVKEQLCIMAYVVNSSGLMVEWNFDLSLVSVCKLVRRVHSGGVRLF